MIQGQLKQKNFGGRRGEKEKKGLSRAEGNPATSLSKKLGGRKMLCEYRGKR